MSRDTNRNRHLPIPGTYNLRDMGGYPTLDGRTTRWGVLFRSDSLHNLGADGLDALVNIGVRAVIDLRHEGETQTAPSPCAKSLLAYRNVPISLNQYLTGGQTEHENLGELYVLMLEYRKGLVCDAIEAIGSHCDRPVLVHCSAGKDRTGIIVALVLAALGVPLEVIATDYAQSGPLIKAMLNNLRQNSRRQGLDMVVVERNFSCDPEHITLALNHLKEKYGSVQEYLLSIGVQKKTITKLHSKLVN